MLDVNQVQDAVSLRNLVPGQPIQLSALYQAWRIRAGQHVLIIANGDNFRVNTEDKALDNTAATQNAQVRMISGRVVSDIVDSDGSILINL